MENLWHTMEELADTMTNQGFPETPTDPCRDVFHASEVVSWYMHHSLVVYEYLKSNRIQEMEGYTDVPMYERI